MRIMDKKVVLERGDFMLEYLTFGEDDYSHLVLVSGINADLTACGLQFTDTQQVLFGNPNRCPRCLKSPFHKMRA